MEYGSVTCSVAQPMITGSQKELHERIYVPYVSGVTLRKPLMRRACCVGRMRRLNPGRPQGGLRALRDMYR